MGKLLEQRNRALDDINAGRTVKKIRDLESRVRELEEENARLRRTNSSYASLTKAQESQLTNLRQRLYQLKGADSAIDSERQANCELTAQLAASQLRETQLREALQTYIDEHEECQDADDWMAMMCSMEAHHAADKALSQPSDTSSLVSFVAEEVKELDEANEHHRQLARVSRDNELKATKQRDLAVEALEKIAAPVRVDGTYNRCREACEILARETLSAIKESKNNKAS